MVLKGCRGRIGTYAVTAVARRLAVMEMRTLMMARWDTRGRQANGGEDEEAAGEPVNRFGWIARHGNPFC